MTVRVQFLCCGCDAETVALARARRVPLSNGSHWHVTRKDSIEDIAPEGWVVFDPYTLVTYCRKCWQKIMDDDVVGGSSG